VSATYFNKLAKEEHLNVRALARGVTPDQDVSMIAAKGFKALNDRRLAILGTQRACLGGRRTAQL
jgi:hypothetical protein